MYEFFWSGPFSNFYPSKFSLNPFNVDAPTYSCVEQYYMAEKAIRFGDSESFKKILETNDPRTHKKLGRKVKGFSDEVWDKYKEAVMYWGNYLKYSQNPKLLDLLLNTGDKKLVEASPYDRIWGIGFTAEDASRHTDESLWGQNLLGKILTQLRDNFKHDREIDALENNSVVSNNT